MADTQLEGVLKLTLDDSEVKKGMDDLPGNAGKGGKDEPTKEVANGIADAVNEARSRRRASRNIFGTRFHSRVRKPLVRSSVDSAA